jgi:hypothetical protein
MALRPSAGQAGDPGGGGGHRLLQARLKTIQKDVTSRFPLRENEVTTFFEQIAAQVSVIHDAEQHAAACLQSVMA